MTTTTEHRLNEFALITKIADYARQAAAQTEPRTSESVMAGFEIARALLTGEGRHRVAEVEDEFTFGEITLPEVERRLRLIAELDSELDAEPGGLL